jgi:L-ascorbate metabolism protein UlaG (beta-lactamase superfamily)
MKKFAFSAILIISLIMYASASPNDVAANIHRFGQASVLLIAGDKKIYIDPFQIGKPDAADVILVTHSHSDHLSMNDIAKVIAPDTIVAAPKDCAAKIEARFGVKVIVVEPGQKILAAGVPVEVVPAYNVKKDAHPKGNGWVGYVLSIDGVRVYHTGDTERIPEMKNIRADIIILPLGQTYTMESVRDAADAALDVQAKIAIPIHYGQFEGKDSDADELKKLLNGKVTVMILERNR